MIRDLVIHLGDTKTGSTSIQQALVQGAYRNTGAVIHYPARTHHNALARTLLRKAQFKNRAARFGRIHDSLSRSEAEIGVISAEHFQFVDPDLFGETLEQYWPDMTDRMRLVAYVRPHAEKLLSSYAERVKLGQVDGSIEDYVESVSRQNMLDYLPRFTAWRDRFGDRFELRPFVRTELFRGDPVADFLRVVLRHERFEITDMATANTALSLPQLALLRVVHDALESGLAARGAEMTADIRDARSAMGRMVAEHMRDQKLGNDGGKLRLPAHLVDPVRARYAEDAAALDAAFFTGTPMRDALDGIERLTGPEGQSLAAEDHFSPQVVAAMRSFGAVLTGMLLHDPKAFHKMALDTRLTFAGDPGASAPVNPA